MGRQKGSGDKQQRQGNVGRPRGKKNKSTKQSRAQDAALAATGGKDAQNRFANWACGGGAESSASSSQEPHPTGNSSASHASAQASDRGGAGGEDHSPRAPQSGQGSSSSGSNPINAPEVGGSRPQAQSQRSSSVHAPGPVSAGADSGGGMKDVFLWLLDPTKGMWDVECPNCVKHGKGKGNLISDGEPCIQFIFNRNNHYVCEFGASYL